MISHDQLNGICVNIGSVFTIISPLLGLTGPLKGGQIVIGDVPGGRKIASFDMAAKSWQM